MIYIAIIGFVTISVGKSLHKNGKVFMSLCLSSYQSWIEPINNSLLLGYYFLNIGIALLKIQMWTQVDSYHEVISSVAVHTSDMLLLLGGIHAFNITALIFMLTESNKSFMNWLKNVKKEFLKLNRDSWKNRYIKKEY